MLFRAKKKAVVFMSKPKNMQFMHYTILFMFDCWADPAVHLLLPKRSMAKGLPMIRSGGIAINWKSVLCEFAFSSPCVFRFVPSVSFLTEILFLTAAAVITTGPEPIKNFSS